MLALAGRRPDPIGAEVRRFPLENAVAVASRLQELFRSRGARILVCSAAAGADLLALQAARELDLRQRIVLPFPPERFRSTSVVDRPGAWAELYDRTIAEAEAAGDLVVLDGAEEESRAYARTNEVILDEAEALAGPEREVRAVIVWEGESKNGDDLTAAFARSAEERGLPVETVLTLRDPA